MRTLALLAALVLSVGGLAGCIGKDEDPVNTNTVTNKNTPGGGDGSGILQVRAPLKAALETEDAVWMAPGSTLKLSASAPANAEGNVTYSWAYGQHPFAGTAPEVALDTGVIEPAASATLTFDQAGIFAMHCHPHPYMKHNVTVVEGYTGVQTTVVQIVDGDTPETFRFVPENIVVATGATVTYENVGTQAHTSTLELAEPALTALDVTGESVEIPLTGDGWMRVLAIVQDEEGRFGTTQHNVYVKDIPADYSESFEGAFDAAATPPAEPPAGGDTINPTLEHPLELVLGGKGKLTVTVDDATGQGVNEVIVHLVADGATQDSLTVNAGETESSGTVNAGAYKLIVQGAQGVQISYTVQLDVVYDLVPPALEAPAAPADGHGGHAGH